MGQGGPRRPQRASRSGACRPGMGEPAGAGVVAQPPREATGRPGQFRRISVHRAGRVEPPARGAESLKNCRTARLLVPPAVVDQPVNAHAAIPLGVAPKVLEWGVTGVDLKDLDHGSLGHAKLRRDRLGERHLALS